MLTNLQRAQVHNLLSWSAVVLWIAAALLWLRSATIDVPTDLASGYGKLVGVEEMSAGFARQAFWNTWSAAISCVAAVAQGFALATKQQRS